MIASSLLEGFRERASGLARSSPFWARALLPLTNAYRALTGDSRKLKLPKEIALAAANLRARRIDGFVVNEEMAARQDQGIAVAMRHFFTTVGVCPAMSVETIAGHVAQYRRLYANAPIAQNDYGMNFPGGLALFVIVRCLSPQLIVESGVYKGLSSYFLAQAAPKARIMAFDPSFAELRHRTPGVDYHRCDWTQVDLSCEGDGLAFFDDHVSHAQRVIEAHRRGFRRLVLDDSWPIEAIFGCGTPPAPSIDMIMADDLAIGSTVTWVEGGALHNYVHTSEMHRLCAQARALIKSAHDVPSLYRQTAIAPSSALKFVELTL
jgi:hypothetical protein